MPLVVGAEEGRGRRRNGPGSCQQAMIRSCPNGETPGGESHRIHADLSVWRVSRGTETSKYPEEKKSYEIPLVAVSEKG